jgi:hypothetical protein
MTGQGVRNDVRRAGAVLHPEVKSDELARPLVLRDRGEVLI